MSAHAFPPVGLGTRLRHLLALLDGEVEQAYRDNAMPGYRPRYTPVVRALQELGPASIKAIAAHAGISHSAVSQTVAQMRRGGWVAARVAADARERTVTMTAALSQLLPRLEAQWRATAAAARTLDRELTRALSTAVDEAIAALQRRPFGARIRQHLVRSRAVPRDRPRSSRRP
jgi:DNA-binding MarR family transcriptional regulator